jgi:hypothetical protein
MEPPLRALRAYIKKIREDTGLEVHVKKTKDAEIESNTDIKARRYFSWVGPPQHPLCEVISKQGSHKSQESSNRQRR